MADERHPIDLPPNVAAQGVQNAAAAANSLMADVAANSVHINNVTRGSIFRKFDEVGTIEGRANSGINGTPIAGPTTGQPVVS